MTVGVTLKFAPLADVPMVVPPVDTVYQLMLFPVEVALRFEFAPTQIAAGDAVTLVGVAGSALTLTVKLAHEVVLHVPSARTKYVVVTVGDTVTEVPDPTEVPPQLPEYH